MSRRTADMMDSELQLRLANRTDVTATMRSQFLNDAYRKIANEFRHAELEGYAAETLTAAESSLTPVAVDIDYPILVKDLTNSIPLHQRDMDEIQSGVIPSGNPSSYYWWGNVFYFDGAPTANLSIGLWYKKLVGELHAGHGAGTSALREVFDPLIIAYAAIIGLQTVRDLAEAQIQEVQANNYIADHKLAPLMAKLNDRRSGIRVRF